VVAWSLETARSPRVLQFHTDTDGNVSVDREFDRVVGC
jgi:hypothetical protein